MVALEPLAKWILSSRSDQLLYETLEVSHPSFSKTYYVVRNNTRGITAQVDGVDTAFEYAPLEIAHEELRRNLDYGIKVTMGDLGEIFATEWPRIKTAKTYHRKCDVTFRNYDSSDLTTPVFVAELQIERFSMTKDGSEFDAVPPFTNRTRTGELYKIGRLPMLRGFV